jgi:hypothetical protein
MKPSAPSQLIWALGLILGILGIIGRFVAIQGVSQNAFWLVLAGFLLLAFGTSFKKM